MSQPTGPIPLWLVDDTSDHHATARATLEALPRFAFTGFLDAGEALDEYRRLAREAPDDLPAIVLMDFYLGEWRGDAVTRELRELQPTTSGLVIVGYSSVAAGSERILAAGADLALRKTRDRSGRNPVLDQWLRQFLAAAGEA